MQRADALTHGSLFHERSRHSWRGSDPTDPKLSKGNGWSRSSHPFQHIGNLRRSLLFQESDWLVVQLRPFLKNLARMGRRGARTTTYAKKPIRGQGGGSSTHSKSTNPSTIFFATLRTHYKILFNDLRLRLPRPMPRLARPAARCGKHISRSAAAAGPAGVATEACPMLIASNEPVW